MTSIDRPRVVGGGAHAPTATKADEAIGDEGRSRGARDDGLVVDRRPGVRSALLVLGLGAVGGGATALGASFLPKFALTSSFGGRNPLLFGGIAAAGIGALLTTVGLAQGPDTIPYLAKVDGSRDDALTRAAQGRTDTGVVRIDRDTWGIVDLSGEETAIDDRGPSGISIGSPPARFDSFVSTFGDAYVRDGDDWRNVGAPDRVESGAIGARDLDRLVGAQLGVTPAGQRVVLGEPVDGTVHATRNDAVRTLFERGRDGVAVVKVRDGYATFALDGGGPRDELAARGFRIEPMSNVELLSSDGLVAAGRPAGPFERTAMPVDDVGSVKLDQAASLTGRRIGDGQLRLGALAGTWPSRGEAAQALFEKAAGPHVLLDLDGGTAAFGIERAVTSFDTMLGSPQRIAMLTADSTSLVGPGPGGTPKGAGPIPTIDAAAVDVSEAASFVGRRIGDGTLRLGELAGTWPDRAAAGRELFEQGAGPTVLVQLRGGVAAYRVERAFDRFQTLLAPGNAAQLRGTTFLTPGADGAVRDGGRIPTQDVGRMPVAEAGTLTGRRIGTEGARLGALVKTYPTTEAAGAALFEAGSPHRLVLRMADGAAVFEAPRFGGFETLLDGGVFSLSGSSWRTRTAEDGGMQSAGRVTVIDASRLGRAEAGQLVGKRFAMEGDRIVRVTGIANQWGSLEQAHAALVGAGGNPVLVQLRDGAVQLQLDGPSDRVETGIHGTMRRQAGKLGFSPSGGGWNFSGRVVPYDVREPMGRELKVPGAGGNAQEHLSSHGSLDAAWSVTDSGSGDFAIVQADGPGGRYHVYRVGHGGGGSWDERLGDVVGVSQFSASTSSYRVEGGGVGSETVYVITERTDVRQRVDDSGSRRTVDSDTYEVGRDVDHSATSSLRRQREAEREEARRRAEEEARRRAEEEARRAAEEAARRQREAEEAARREVEEAARRQREAAEAERRRQEEANRPPPPPSSGGSGGAYNPPSGGSGGGYYPPPSSGGSSGSGGNSNPGSGGGHDPGGGGAGSDW